MDIKVGKRYILRNKMIVIIENIVRPDNHFYNKGYRFKGRTIHDEDDAFYATYIMLFRSDGKQFANDVNVTSTPYDIIEPYIEKPRVVKVQDVTVRAFAGTEEFGMIVGGPFANWKVERRYDIDDRTYAFLVQNNFMRVEDNYNKTFLVSVEGTGSSGDVISALVVVALDHDENGALYQMLVLTMGEHTA